MVRRTVEVMGGKTRLVSIMFNLKIEDNSVFAFNYDHAILTSQIKTQETRQREGRWPCRGCQNARGRILS